MPFSALPDHLNPYKNPDAWKGTDHDHWTIHWKVRIIGWFAFGPRATEWWAKWREYPKTLFAMAGDGFWRFEDNEGDSSISTDGRWYVLNEDFVLEYISRVQYWCNWHIQLQWPLFFAFHFGNWQGYVGFKRDADRVYWLALYFGRKWK